MERVLAKGSSQAAHRLTTYANDVDPLAQVFDGIFVHARGGFRAPLDVDRDPPSGIPEKPVRFSAEQRVPVVCVQAETDVCIGGSAARQDDNEMFVLWEIAGTSHADSCYSAVAPIDAGALPVAELAAAMRSASLLEPRLSSAAIWSASGWKVRETVGVPLRGSFSGWSRCPCSLASNVMSNTPRTRH